MSRIGWLVQQAAREQLIPLEGESCHHNGRYPDALPDVLPLFAGIVLFTHRELIAHLLNTEPDWPWHEPPHKRQRTGLNSSPE